jgi:hypothetical protein
MSALQDDCSRVTAEQICLHPGSLLYALHLLAVLCLTLLSGCHLYLARPAVAYLLCLQGVVVMYNLDPDTTALHVLTLLA